MNSSTVDTTEAPLNVAGARVARIAAPVRQQVEDLLREAIVTQALAPGQRLIERELVEWLAVSRTTVREALRHLAAEGLVKTIPQKGVVVAVPTQAEAEEIYELRAVLEGLIAAQFTTRASAEQIRSLRTAFEHLKTTLLGPEPVGLPGRIQAKDRFYQTLVGGAQNETVRGVLDQLQARISVLRATSLSLPGRGVESVQEMGRIVEAVESGDAAAASEAASLHVRQAAQALFKVTEAGASARLVFSADDGAGEDSSAHRVGSRSVKGDHA